MSIVMLLVSRRNQEMAAKYDCLDIFARRNKVVAQEGAGAVALLLPLSGGSEIRLKYIQMKTVSIISGAGRTAISVFLASLDITGFVA